MNVLILSQYYWPEPLPKAQELAEGLRARGHRVSVLTGFPNYPTGRLYDGYAIRPWTRTRTEQGIDVWRVALFPDHSKSAFRRVLNYGSFAVAASLVGSSLMPRPDVIFACHPPLTIGPAADVIARLKRVPFVYAVADLWPAVLVASGLVSSPRIIAALERLEHFVYRRASAIAVVTPPMIDYLVGRGVPRHKLRIVPDWVDERVYHPVPPDPTLASALGLAGRFNVVFAGQLGIVQRLGTVIAAAELLKDDGTIQFVIVGDGVERAGLEKEVSRRALHNVRFLGRLPPSDMPGIYALADVLLVHLGADAILRLSIPGKVYAYLASGKPILAAANGATAELITSCGAGLVCAPERPETLAEAVRAFARLPRETREEMGRQGRETFLSQYSREVVLDHCEQLLLDVAQDAPSVKAIREGRASR